jgi:NACHT domain/WD domain, G-beta repeat
VHVRSVQDWEAGVNYPSAERLRAIIVTLLESGGLTPAHETEDAEALWSAVEHASPRMHTPFDGAWFAALLDQASSPETPASDVMPSQDWGEASDVLGFVGRTDELSQLQRWVVDERCRTVAVVGIGGIGKTALAARLAQDVAPRFERVYWRSLRDAPPPGTWLAGAIGFLSDQQSVPAPGASEQVATLLRLLRARRCLVVLDNFETLLEPGMGDGSYRPGLAQYAHVVQAVADSAHQSCLVLTSREAPLELAASRGDAVRTLTLRGLSVREGQELLARVHLIGSDDHWRDLIERYGGNGLALKVVGDTIGESFVGDIGAFLQETGTSSVFGGIRRLLSEQIERISALEQQILRVLAIEREPVPLGDLLAMLELRVRRGPALQAVEALRRHSLAERTESGARAAFTLQSVVLEYVTDRLVEDVADEINRCEPVVLAEHPLIRALAPDYVRQSQERLIGTPIVQLLQRGGAEQSLLALLHMWRVAPRPQQCYGPGNAVNLLRLQRGDLNGLDFSGLSIRQAYLADIDAHAASLAGSDLAESVLGEAFDFPCSVALSGDGALLAVGASTGEVWVWRCADRALVAALRGHIGVAWSVALSAAGHVLASGGEDGTVRLWDTHSGRPLMAQLAHSGVLRSLAISADGQLVASGGFDGALRMWDAGAGTLVRALRSARRYEGLDITDLTGITQAQREALVALGAVDRSI